MLLHFQNELHVAGAGVTFCKVLKVNIKYLGCKILRVTVPHI